MVVFSISQWLAGVFQFSVLRGLSLISKATVASLSGL